MRARAQAVAQTRSSATARNEFAPTSPPRKTPADAATANASIADARRGYGPPGSTSVASHPPSAIQRSRGRPVTSPTASGTTVAVAARRRVDSTGPLSARRGGMQAEPVPDSGHGRRTLRALLRRSALSARRPGRRGAARAPRRARPLSRGADLLRPADGQRGFLRRGPAAGAQDGGGVRAVRARGLPVGELHLDGAQSFRSLAAGRRRAARQDARAVRVPPRRPANPPQGPLPPPRRPAPELPRPSRAAPRQWQRAARSALRQGARAARGHRGAATRRAGETRRVLRFRRHLRRQRGCRLVRHGARPHRRPPARRGGDHRGSRYVVSHAPGGIVAARRQASARHARGGAPGRGDRVTHAAKAAAFVANDARMHWHDQAVWFVRQKRDVARAAVPEWEELRGLASQIKAHALSRLADYLELFEKNAVAAGAQVHWARDADEHNRIVHGLLAARGVTRLVKSKSMLTEECHLNPYLE